MSKKARALCLIFAALGFVFVAASPVQAVRDIRYVALGDSISAGTGSWPKISDGDPGCHQSESGYPYLYFQANINRMKTFDLNACHGNTTQQLLDNQMRGLDGRTTLVTMTIGVNDLNWGHIISRCVTQNQDECTRAYLEGADMMDSGELARRLENVYLQIALAAPNAKVVVFGYPMLFNAAVPDGDCPQPNQYSRLMLNRGADQLNRIIQTEVAKRAGFVFLPVSEDFNGHRVCDPVEEQWINGLLLGDQDESYHPNMDGYLNSYFLRLSLLA